MVSGVGLSDDEVRERLVAATRAVDEAQVALAEWTVEWERRGAWAADGSRNVSASVSIATGCSVTTARERVARGHALERMPHTRAAVGRGLGLDRVDLLARAATPERLVLFARDEPMLVAQVLAARVFADARRIVDYWCQAADDELGHGAPADPVGRVWLSRDQVSGRGVLDGELDPVGAEIVDRELRRLSEELRHHDRRTGATRTAAQRRAAALVLMAARSAGADGPTTRPLFEVIVGEESMRRLCELSSGIVVRPHQLVDWTDIAVFESFLFGDATTIISVSKQRTFRGCAAPGGHGAGPALPARFRVRDQRRPLRHRSPSARRTGRTHQPVQRQPRLLATQPHHPPRYETTPGTRTHHHPR